MSDIISGRFDGTPGIALVPTLREDLPAELREGLARRRLIADGRPCPCGARPPQLSRRIRRQLAARHRKGRPTPATRIDVVHEPDCPALDPRLREHGRRFDYVAWTP